MTPKIDINEAVRRFGGPRDNLRIGDHVLTEVSDTQNGYYIVLHQITAVSESTVTVKKLWTYYLNGNEFPGDNSESVVELETLRKPITQRLQEAKDFWEWFGARMKSNEAKYGNT